MKTLISAKLELTWGWVLSAFPCRGITLLFFLNYFICVNSIASRMIHGECSPIYRRSHISVWWISMGEVGRKRSTVQSIYTYPSWFNHQGLVAVVPERGRAAVERARQGPRSTGYLHCLFKKESKVPVAIAHVNLLTHSLLLERLPPEEHNGGFQLAERVFKRRVNS